MEKRNWKRSVTLKQRMVLCLAAFFAAFALQLALNGYQARAVQQVQDDQMGNFNAISRFQGGVESSISILEAYRGASDPIWMACRTSAMSSGCFTAQWRPPTAATAPCWRNWRAAFPAGRMQRRPSCTITRSRSAAGI